MVKIAFLIVFYVFSSLFVNGQDCSLINWEKKSGISYIDNRSFLNLKNINETNIGLKECVKYVDSKIHKAKIYNIIATNHHFLESSRDSIIKYSLRAYHTEPNWYCYVMCTRAFLGPEEFEEYYMLSFEEDLQQKGVKCNCSEYPMSIEEYRLENDIKRSEEEDIDYINSLLLTVGEQDQRYRSLGEVSQLQKDLDRKNQDDINEMYALHGFPKNSKNIFITWLVVHHSVDCDFKKKWLAILLDNYKNGLVDIKDLAIVFKRFKNIMLKEYCGKEEDEKYANMFLTKILSKDKKRFELLISD